jgi:hypothetical protein
MVYTPFYTPTAARIAAAVLVQGSLKASGWIVTASHRRGWRDPEKREMHSKSGDKMETATSLPSVATDFESSASANSATPAQPVY